MKLKILTTFHRMYNFILFILKRIIDVGANFADYLLGEKFDYFKYEKTKVSSKKRSKKINLVHIDKVEWIHSHIIHIY